MDRDATRATGGSPARRGDTAVRPAAPWTASVHALLSHLHARDIDWVPEPRGVAAGHARVSWVEGEVPAYPMPAYVWAPAVLDRAASMLRELHDATEGFDRAGRVWALPEHEPAEVICHNDFAPYNLAFRAGLPAGAIDFEAASPARAPGTSRTSPTASSRSRTPRTPTSRRAPTPPSASRGSAAPTATSTRRPCARWCRDASESSPPRPRPPTPPSTAPTPPTSTGQFPCLCRSK